MKGPTVAGARVRAGAWLTPSLVLLFAAGAAGAAAPDDPAFGGFEHWLARYRAASAAADAPAMSAAADEGKALARERRQALLRLARTDPRAALARALSPAQLRSLPAAVQQESEEIVDTCGGDFGVEIRDNFTDDQAPVSRVVRTLTVGDRTFEALVFGKRLGTASKAIHANGIALDGVVVLYE
ncbi:MAG TPA: hypothetical protein VF310_08100, partial [Vicinamibacteria bacterium]